MANNMIRFNRFATLLLGALGLTPGAAHVLELGPKMQYDAEMYMAVTSTLYRFFGSIGALIQLGAILMAITLTLLVRHQPAFRQTLFGTLGLVLSMALWAVLVAPVNAEWLEIMKSAPDFAPEAYRRLRPRWEYGHVAAFVAWLAGFCLLLLSVLARTPPDRGHLDTLTADRLRQ